MDNLTSTRCPDCGSEIALGLLACPSCARLVHADRLKHEYGLKTDFDPAPCDAVRWIRAKDPAALKKFIEGNRSSIATDLDGDYVYLPGSIFNLNYNAGRNPDVEFLEIKT